MYVNENNVCCGNQFESRIYFIFGILGYYDLCIFKIIIDDFVFGDDIV